MSSLGTESLSAAPQQGQGQQEALLGTARAREFCRSLTYSQIWGEFQTVYEQFGLKPNDLGLLHEVIEVCAVSNMCCVHNDKSVLFHRSIAASLPPLVA